MLSTLNIDASWDKYLVPLLTSDIGIKLINDLNERSYHPDKKNIFKALSMPVNDVKLVIVGQDVYPDKSLATGIAFGVPLGKDSASLKIIRKELHRQYHEDVTHDLFMTEQCDIDYLFDNTMMDWHEQGVMLLNSALTCDTKPGDQWDLWQPFMTQLIRIVDTYTEASFIFLGKKAATMQKLVYDGWVFPHPAADAYGKQQFVGSNIFYKMDDLTDNKIKWIKNINISSQEAMTGDLPF